VNILGWIMAGWGSDNRYAIIGALRAAAQGISYEIPLVLALVSAGMFAGTFNLASIAEAQGHIPFIVWQPMAFMIFFIAMLAELNRPPFDIPVGESEVVGGPFIEYSGIRWSMFFLAEYAALFIMALIGSTVFLGGWAWPLGEEVGVGLQFLLTVVKAGLLIFIVFWVRATAPRLRIDQLMGFAWKVLIPLVFVQVMVNGLVMLYEWPDVVLLVAGLAGCAALAWSIGYSVRLPRPARRPVPARSEAAS
jgi:NADH-quinone oxidoreductase subunit H